jgi:DNA transformation protein
VDREDIAELFSAFGPVSVRRMFSGFGLYADDVCFSLFLRGELYLKADETTAPRFAAEGSRPFSYTQPTSGKVVTVNSFWRLPERLYDDPDDLAEWAKVAVAAAHRQKLGKRKRVQKPAASKRTRPAAKPAPRPARKRLKAKKAR